MCCDYHIGSDYMNKRKNCMVKCGAIIAGDQINTALSANTNEKKEEKSQTEK